MFKIVIVSFLLVLAPLSCYAEEHTQSSPTPAPWLRDKIAILKAMADKGDADAQQDLGVIYLTGFEDPKEAYKWFGMAAEGYGKAAEEGDANAQYHLGDMINHGFAPGGIDLAARWFYRAGKQGNAEAMALALKLDPALVHGEHPTFTERMKHFKQEVEQTKAERAKAENPQPARAVEAPVAPSTATSPPASK